MSESKFYYFSASGLFYAVKTPQEAIETAKEGGFVWFNYFKPVKEDLSALMEPLGIHPLSIEDCMDEKQLPKVEQFQKNTFFIFNAFSYVEKTLSIDEVDLFVGKNFLITVSRSQNSEKNPLCGLEQVIENEIDRAKSGPAFLMHIIIDYIVDQKFFAIEALEDELEEAEELLLSDPSHFDPTQLVRLRRSLLNLRKSLFHEREILVKIYRKDCLFIPENSLIHFRDIYDHLAKSFELVETYRETVTSLLELYTSLLNNILTKTSNETNTSVRRLTLIATIFMPLTLLAGIGGMSEWTMITGPSNWRIAYPAFMVGMAVIGVISYILIRRTEKRTNPD